MGLTLQSQGSQERALALFTESHVNLNDALKIRGRHCSAAEPPVVWLRQKVETLVWSSWLKLESGPPRESGRRLQGR